MPHMMPMLWMMIFCASFLFLFVLSTMLYFFYLPNVKEIKTFNKTPKLKWNWMW